MKDKLRLPVSITFDDGRIIQYENYFSILNDFSLRASFYVVTGWIGEPGFIRLNEIIDLWNHKNEIGSHTHTHVRLSTLSEKEIESELQKSKSLLKTFNCTTFAYPFGDYSDDVIRHTKKYYIAARTYTTLSPEEGKFRYNQDIETQRYQLRAFPIEHACSPEAAVLISLPLPKFKKMIERIVVQGIENKAWTIFVFHGSTKYDLRCVVRTLFSRRSLHAVRSVGEMLASMRPRLHKDELMKFRWMCEFLASNESVNVLPVAEAMNYMTKHQSIGAR